MMFGYLNTRTNSVLRNEHFNADDTLNAAGEAVLLEAVTTAKNEPSKRVIKKHCYRENCWDWRSWKVGHIHYSSPGTLGVRVTSKPVDNGREAYYYAHAPKFYVPSIYGTATRVAPRGRAVLSWLESNSRLIDPIARFEHAGNIVGPDAALYAARHHYGSAWRKEEREAGKNAGRNMRKWKLVDGEQTINPEWDDPKKSGDVVINGVRTTPDFAVKVLRPRTIVRALDTVTADPTLNMDDAATIERKWDEAIKKSPIVYNNEAINSLAKLRATLAVRKAGMVDPVNDYSPPQPIRRYAPPPTTVAPPQENVLPYAVPAIAAAALLLYVVLKRSS